MKRWRRLGGQVRTAACSALASSVATAVLIDGNAFASGVLFMGLGTLIMVSTCVLTEWQ